MSVRSSIVVLAVLAVVGLLAFGLLSKGSGGIALGETAPQKTLPRLEGGGEESLADYRGRWVLVNFWASWCEPCREEAPALEDFQREYGGEDFTVLGIDTQDLTADGLAFAERYDLSYPQLHDGDGGAADEFGSKGVPENYLIDPQGKVRRLFLGAISAEYLEDEVAPLLPGGGS